MAARERKLRCNIRKFLNRPGYHGNASITAYVERGGKRKHHWPYVHFQVSDCGETITLDFGGYSAAERENSLYKADTLLASIQKFRDSLYEEAKRFPDDDEEDSEDW